MDTPYRGTPPLPYIPEPKPMNTNQDPDHLSFLTFIYRRICPHSVILFRKKYLSADLRFNFVEQW